MNFELIKSLQNEILCNDEFIKRTKIEILYIKYAIHMIPLNQNNINTNMYCNQRIIKIFTHMLNEFKY
jgi:hypothetical protein